MGDDEIFHLAINGASSNISVQDLEDDKITLFIKGNLMKDCDSIEQTIEIYNFCKGENNCPQVNAKANPRKRANGGVTHVENACKPGI